jgi:hypothetical protein
MRMHALFLTTEDAVRAHAADDGTPAARRAIAKAEARRRQARAVALKSVPPAQMRTQTTQWLDSLSAVADAVTDVARLHTEANHRVAGHLAGPVVSGPDYTDRAAESVRAELEAMTGPDRSTSRTPARSGNRTKARRSAVRSGTDRADRSAHLAIVSGLLDQAPAASGPDAQATLAAAGHTVSDGHARRLLREARAIAGDQTAEATPVPVTDHAPATASMLSMVEA